MEKPQIYGLIHGSKGSTLLNKVGRNAIDAVNEHNTKVSVLISNNNGTQSMDNIPSQFHNIIRNINIQTHKEKDYWVWNPNSNEQCSMKSASNQVRNKYTEYFWTKIIWDKGCAPKMSICALVDIQNKLNTKERISRWNSNMDQKCILCSNQL